MEAKTDRIDELLGLEALALKVLKKRFKQGLDALQDEYEANDAVRVLGIVQRGLATERVKDATQFSVIRAISTDQKQMEEYLRISLPHLTPTKLLGRPKK